MKPRSRIWRVVALLCIMAYLVIAPSPLILKAQATSGTWVIENETVEIKDSTFIHEGIIVIRGSGQLALVNSTLKLKQVTSWQFSIRLEDSAMLSITDSQLQAVYPYRVTLQGNSSLLTQSSAAPLVSIHIESSAASVCTNSSFLEIVAGTISDVTLTGCIAERASVSGDSSIHIDRCEVGVLRCQQNSMTAIENSTVNTALLDDTATTDLTDSGVNQVWCWLSSSFFAHSCDIYRIQYYDTASITVQESSMDYLVGAGSVPIMLDSLTIQEVTLTGWAHVSLVSCVVENIFCDWHSTLRFINGSCDYIEALEWANVSIVGTPSSKCNVTTYGAFADTSSQIAWADFYRINLGHRTRTWISDSSAYTIQSFAYDGASPLIMYRCIVEWELRMSWGVEGEIHDSTADNVLVYGYSSINASGCEFLNIMIGDVDDAMIRNCTIGGLFPAGEARVNVAESDVCIGIQPDPHTTSSFDQLPAGYVNDWNSLESGAIQGLAWNLTVLDSQVSWKAVLRYDSIVELSNSNIAYIACDESCVVGIQNLTIDHLTVTRHSDVSMSVGTIANLDCGLWSTSTFEDVQVTNVFTIGDAYTTFHNCTITNSWAGGDSTPHFENCTIITHRASGGSSSHILNSTLGTLYSYDESINYCYDTEILDLLTCYHVSMLTLSKCTISSLTVGNTAVLQVEDCSIGSLTTEDSSQITCVDSSIESLDCEDFSVVQFLGNLTGLTSLSVTESGSVARQIEMTVTDGNGQEVEGAMVEVYNSADQLIVRLQTTSDGGVKFGILFIESNCTLLEVFSFNVSKGESSSQGQFIITDSIPIRVTLELASVPAASQDPDCSPLVAPEQELTGNLHFAIFVEIVLLVQKSALIVVILPISIHFLAVQKRILERFRISRTCKRISWRDDK